MLNALSEDINTDLKFTLNTPNKDEDIVSVCHKLIVSLNLAKTRGEKILKMIFMMKNKYTNPPL